MDAGAGAAVAWCDPIPAVPGDSLFEQAVLCALTRWDPLKFAINEGIRAEDGPDLVLWMPTVILERVAKGKGEVEPTDLEEYILDIMDQEFNMQIDEHGAFFLTKQILQFWKDCETGDTAALRRYVEESTGKRLFTELFARYGFGAPQLPEDALAAGVASIELDGSGDAAMEPAEAEAEPEADPDGWEVVTTKKKRGGKR